MMILLEKSANNDAFDTVVVDSSCLVDDWNGTVEDEDGNHVDCSWDGHERWDSGGVAVAGGNDYSAKEVVGIGY